MLEHDLLVRRAGAPSRTVTTGLDSARPRCLNGGNKRFWGCVVIQHQGLARWHAAVRSHVAHDIIGLIAVDAVFHSPVVFSPQHGRDLVAGYLTAAMHVLNNDSFHYVGEWLSQDGAVLEFNTVVDGITIDGIDMIHWNADGQIDMFKVMVRPLKAINLLHQKMADMLTAMGKL